MNYKNIIQKKFSAILFAYFVIIQSATNAMAVDITVNTSDDDTLAVLDSGGVNGTCSLREAIQNANTDSNSYKDCVTGSGSDTIKFSGVTSITLKDDVFVITDVTIQGAITLSGGNVTRIFTVSSSSGALHFQNVLLQNGSDASGGAILVSSVGSLLECDNSSFKDNKADSSGGAISSSGTLDIDSCTFDNNQAGDDGGAIEKNSGSIVTASMTINSSNFTNNKAGTDPASQTNGGVGGAIHFTTSLANITSSRFNKNTATAGSTATANGGGAIRNNGTMNITASVFAGNETSGDKWHGGAIYNDGNLSVNFSHFGTTPLPLPAPFNTLTDPNKSNGTAALGGAIYTFGPTLVLGSSFIGNTSAFNGGALASASTGDNVTIGNSTFSVNDATLRGGAIYNAAGDSLVTLRNVSIANNSAAEGGGLYNLGDGDNVDTTNDEFLLENVILSDNSAIIGANCGGGTVASESINNVVFPLSKPCPNANAITDSPSLGSAELTFSLANIITYALPLGSSSSALGAGDAATCAGLPIINLDQRGFPRPQGDPICDIGAYESSSSKPTATPTSTSTPTVTNTASNTSTATNTYTPTNTATSTATGSPTNTYTNTSISSSTATATQTATSTLTATNTFTATNSATATSTATPTTSSSITSSNTATATNTASATNTFTNTPIISISASPSFTPTNTSTNTPSNTYTANNTATFTNTYTPAQTSPSSPSPTPSFPNETQTETATATATATSTASDIVTIATPATTPGADCATVNITSIQFSLDGQAAAQLKLIKDAQRLVKRASSSKQDTTAAKKIVDSANITYMAMWKTVWNYQSSILTCPGTSLCAKVDLTPSANSFKSNSQKMVDLSSQIVKLLRKVKSSKTAGSDILKKVKAQDTSIRSSVDKIPLTASSCA